MKKIIVLLALGHYFCLLSFVDGLTSEPQLSPCGGCYQTISKTRSDVIVAAKFAASQLFPLYTTVLVKDAQAQIVSGINYKLSVRISSDSTCATQQVIAKAIIPSPIFRGSRGLTESVESKTPVKKTPCNCYYDYNVIVWKKIDNTLQLTSSTLASKTCAK